MTTITVDTAISLTDYYMGRELLYGGDLTPERQLNALTTVSRVNTLIAALVAAGVDIEVNPRTGTLISSGWRPAVLNGTIPGAAPKSKHITCQACDLYDPDGAIDDWCMEHLDVLEKIGLWLEHPSATKSWAHLQTVPPRSGNRVFYP